MADQGTFIVIEGTDGSGKGTQVKNLVERLEKDGYSVAVFDFPQYDKDSSFFVREYLNGRYGSAEEVGPYTGSLFFSLDRYEAASEIRKALDQGKIVIANRFTGSNMAHQGTKFDNTEQRRGFFVWLDQLEFEMLKIPRPTLSLVLRVPAEIAQTLVDKKPSRSYTANKRDLHEADLLHMQRSVEVYDNLCELFPKDFRALDCTRGGKLLDAAAVHNLVWETLRPLLPASPKEGDDAKKKAVKTPNKFLNKTENGLEPTAEGWRFLESAVTSVDGDVYAFNNTLPPQTIAAAMARLSRRADDMRITLLDEFAPDAGKDDELLKRIITAYGDDSVQQLIGQHIVVENASNLLTKKLEWGRLGAYLEQSTRYIYFDQKDKNGNYRYYVPENLSDSAKRTYTKLLDQIYGLYSEMVHELTDYVRAHSSVPKNEQDAAWMAATRAQACDAARAVLPVAATATVGIFASAQALESLIMHLLGDPLAEARQAGRQILAEARKTIPVFLERADKSDRGGAQIVYRATTAADVSVLAEKYMAKGHGSDIQSVALSDIWPANELDLLADMLYEYSEASLDEIRTEVDLWPYHQKREAFQAYMGKRLNRRHRPGRALEKAHYSFDLLCDYGIFRDLQRHRMVDDMNWQKLTPRYGYEVPKLIEDAGLSEKYEKCFDISLKLYSVLQGQGYIDEAQYATLLGHKMRWKVTMNAREAFHFMELRTSPQGHPGYRRLVQQMYDKICEVHPLIGEAMKFVNKEEAPALTRLAAEQAAQKRLGT